MMTVGVLYAKMQKKIGIILIRKDWKFFWKIKFKKTTRL
jgi:hypothetical protein